MDMKAIHLQRGENIANIRKRRGYTQEQLAELLGISKSYLAHVEQGDAQFSVDTLWRFVSVLHVSADEVFFGRDDSSRVQEILTMLDDNSVSSLDKICDILHIIVEKERLGCRSFPWRTSHVRRESRYYGEVSHMDKDQLAKTIGENIFYYRKAAQMTQGKLAEQLQVSTAFLCRLERGEKIPGVLTLLMAAQALHVSTDALLYENGQFSHERNILVMLRGQSETSIKRIERIVRVLLQEYP